MLSHDPPGRRVDIVSLSKGGQKGEIGRKEKRKAEDEPSGKVSYKQKLVPQGVFSTYEYNSFRRPYQRERA
jgi:hypothetical protein